MMLAQVLHQKKNRHPHGPPFLVTDYMGCWTHARRKFVETLDEDMEHASEALVSAGYGA